MFRSIRIALIFLAAIVAAPAPATAANRIDRVEPTSWWVGMKDPRLQLLVHGTNVAALEPAVDHPGVTIVGTDRVANPNYLFLNLHIAPDARR